MTVSTNSGDTASPPCDLSKRKPRLPEHLDIAMMQRRHGRILGTLQVWRNRIRARGEIQRLALWAPDSVLEDAGMTRAAAEREVRRWFWQDFLR